MKERDKSLEVKYLEEHQITTVCGSFKMRRRLYQNSNGKYRFLLDGKTGDEGCHTSHRVQELATFYDAPPRR